MAQETVRKLPGNEDNAQSPGKEQILTAQDLGHCQSPAPGRAAGTRRRGQHRAGGAMAAPTPTPMFCLSLQMKGVMTDLVHLRPSY